MSTDLERLIQDQSDAFHSQREQETARSLRRAKAAGLLDDRRRAAEAEAARLVRFIRDDPDDPFRGRSDEEIAGELLRRLSL